MTAKRKKPADKSGPEDRFLYAFDGFLDAEGPSMITGWAVVIEYIDKNGDMQLSAFASDTPSWRIDGMLREGIDMLTYEHEYDDWNEE